jgi:hypothetical protein
VYIIFKFFKLHNSAPKPGNCPNLPRLDKALSITLTVKPCLLQTQTTSFVVSSYQDSQET